jgi:hypothetical protein
VSFQHQAVSNSRRSTLENAALPPGASAAELCFVNRSPEIGEGQCRAMRALGPARSGPRCVRGCGLDRSSGILTICCIIARDDEADCFFHNNNNNNTIHLFCHPWRFPCVSRSNSYYFVQRTPIAHHYRGAVGQGSTADPRSPKGIYLLPNGYVLQSSPEPSSPPCTNCKYKPDRTRVIY